MPKQKYEYDQFYGQLGPANSTIDAYAAKGWKVHTFEIIMDAKGFTGTVIVLFEREYVEPTQEEKWGRSSES